MSDDCVCGAAAVPVSAVHGMRATSHIKLQLWTLSALCYGLIAAKTPSILASNSAAIRVKRNGIVDINIATKEDFLAFQDSRTTGTGVDLDISRINNANITWSAISDTELGVVFVAVRQIAGSLFISGCEELTNLKPALNKVESIIGGGLVEKCSKLKTVEMIGVKSIGGDLTIRDNPTMQGISLPELERVSGVFTISGLTNLLALHGNSGLGVGRLKYAGGILLKGLAVKELTLPNVQKIGASSLRVQELQVLGTMSMSGLADVEGSIELTGCQNLQVVSFATLTYIGQFLEFDTLRDLVKVDAPVLNKVGRSFVIKDCPNLADLCNVQLKADGLTQDFKVDTFSQALNKGQVSLFQKAGIDAEPCTSGAATPPAPPPPPDTTTVTTVTGTTTVTSKTATTVTQTFTSVTTATVTTTTIACNSCCSEGIKGDSVVFLFSLAGVFILGSCFGVGVFWIYMNPTNCCMNENEKHIHRQQSIVNLSSSKKHSGVGVDNRRSVGGHPGPSGTDMQLVTISPQRQMDTGYIDMNGQDGDQAVIY